VVAVDGKTKPFSRVSYPKVIESFDNLFFGCCEIALIKMEIIKTTESS